MPFDWWKVRHKVADGDPVKFLAAGKLTLPQLFCLASERPPRAGKRPETFADHEAMRAGRLAGDDAWDA